MESISTTQHPLPLKGQMIRGLRTSWYESWPKNATNETPILFFLHGFPETPRTFEAQFLELKRNYIIVAPFSRGLIESKGKAGKRFSLKEVLADHLEILKLTDPQEQRPIFIITHDIGVIQGLEIASELRARIFGLIMMAGLSPSQIVRRWSDLKQIKKSWYLLFFQVPYLSEKLWDTFEDRFLQFGEKKGNDEIHRQYSPRKMGKMLQFYREGTMQWLNGVFPSLRGEHPVERLKSPVLAIFGDEDAFLNIPSDQEMQVICETSQVKVLPGGHWIHREKALEVNVMINDFIKQHLTEKSDQDYDYNETH